MNKEKKINVLIFNNSHSEFHLINLLKKQKKYNIFTVGDINPAVSLGLTHFKINYQDLKKIKQIIESNDIRYFIPCANDISLFSITDLKLSRKFDSKIVTETLHDKLKYRIFEKSIFKNTINFFPVSKIKKIKKSIIHYY